MRYLCMRSCRGTQAIGVGLPIARTAQKKSKSRTCLVGRDKDQPKSSSFLGRKEIR